MVNYDDILKSQKRIAPYIIKTPLLKIDALNEIAGCNVYLKPENLQRTGSFKIRGAFNSLLQLTQEEKERGIVTASSGNHAIAVCYAASILKIKVTVIMPENPNNTKLKIILSLGATVEFVGTKSSERAQRALELQQEGKVLIHSHADENVIAGQGTIACEILDDYFAIDTLVVPIGGGGLICGIATAAKALKKEIKIIGIEPSGAPLFWESLKANKPVTLKNIQTIADGTRCDHANPNNFEIIKNLVDEIHLVDEQLIKDAMKEFIVKAKIVAEPSSSLGLAASLSKSISFNEDENVCFIVSGGNNDLNLLKSIL